MHQQAEVVGAENVDGIENVVGAENIELTKEEKLLKELKECVMKLEHLGKEKKETDRQLTFCERKKASLAVEVASLEAEVSENYKKEDLLDAKVDNLRKDLQSLTEIIAKLVKTLATSELRVQSLTQQLLAAKHSAVVQVREAQLLVEEAKRNAEGMFILEKHSIEAEVIAQYFATSAGNSSRELKLENDLAEEKRKCDQRDEDLLKCLELFNNVAAAFQQFRKPSQQTCDVMGERDQPPIPVLQECGVMVDHIRSSYVKSTEQGKI